MKLQQILKRVEKRLKAVGMSADKASKTAGKVDAIRNMRRAVKEGARQGVSTDTIDALAPVLKTTSAWLISGKGPEQAGDRHIDSADILTDAESSSTRVRIVGYVGAGSEAHFYKYADEDFDEVEAPAGSSDQTVAVEIRGKSFGPLMDTWLVFYDDVRSPITEDLYGQVCVVGLADDRILIKKIQRNGDGTFDLLSNGADAPIKGATIEWAAKVTDMRPR